MKDIENIKNRVILYDLTQRCAMEVIKGLSTVEEELKKVWEAKREITHSFYLIPLMHIPQGLYKEIANHNKQWEQWEEVYKVGNIKDKEDFLKQNQGMVVDTRNFTEDFTRNVLSHFSNLDEAMDGLLVHSENWQAMNTLMDIYKERVKTIYIDPPYNTGSNDFLYRDRYHEFSWLNMMYERLELAKGLLRKDGAIFVNIDDNESHHLRLIMDRVFGKDNYCNSIVWVYANTARGGKAVTNRLPRNYDTILFYAKDINHLVTNRVSVDVRYTLEEARKRGFKRDQEGRWFKSAPRGNYTDKSIEDLSKAGRIYITKNGNIRIKYFLEQKEGHIIEKRLLSDVWTDIPDMMHAPREERTGFNTQKPLSLIKRILKLTCSNNDYCMDFFGGSGTLAHAVIDLNNEDNGRRRFILIEMEAHFDTVIIPRIMRAIFNLNKSGKTPKIIRAISLKGFEQALNSTKALLNLKN